MLIIVTKAVGLHFYQQKACQTINLLKKRVFSRLVQRVCTKTVLPRTKPVKRRARRKNGRRILADYRRALFKQNLARILRWGRGDEPLASLSSTASVRAVRMAAGAEPPA